MDRFIKPVVRGVAVSISFYLIGAFTNWDWGWLLSLGELATHQRSVIIGSYCGTLFAVCIYPGNVFND